MVVIHLETPRISNCRGLGASSYRCHSELQSNGISSAVFFESWFSEGTTFTLSWPFLSFAWLTQPKIDRWHSLSSQPSVGSAGLKRANGPRGELERGFPLFDFFWHEHPEGLFAVKTKTLVNSMAVSGLNIFLLALWLTKVSLISV